MYKIYIKWKIYTKNIIKEPGLLVCCFSSSSVYYSITIQNRDETALCFSYHIMIFFFIFEKDYFSGYAQELVTKWVHEKNFNNSMKMHFISYAKALKYVNNNTRYKLCLDWSSVAHWYSRWNRWDNLRITEQKGSNYTLNERLKVVKYWFEITSFYFSAFLRKMANYGEKFLENYKINCWQDQRDC